jgi:integrase
MKRQEASVMRTDRPFTDKFLQSLKPALGPYDVCDPARRGLTVRVFPSGTKTFVFRYRRQGRLVRISIGHYPHITLREAYEKHAEYVKNLHRGEALQGFRSASNAQGEKKPPALTVGDLAEEFLRRYIYVERKQPRDAEFIIEGNILKFWKHRPVAEITRRDAVLLLDKVVDRGAPVMANRVGALLSQMFRFGVERGILHASPFVALPRPGGREKSRSRQLDEREIRLFWRRLRTPKISAPVQLALKLILVTAQRPGEVAFAARSEFDLEARTWTIPAERSKNGLPHNVPLSDLAITLLRHLKRLTGETEFIVPTRCWRKRGTAPITIRAVSQAVRDNRKGFGLPDFTPHDLRRTAASRMTALGVPRLHVEKILNHTLTDVAEVYDRHDYTEEKRVALEKWGAALMRVLKSGSSNVVAIRPPAVSRQAG